MTGHATGYRIALPALLALALVANSAYLASSSVASVFHFVNVAAHLLLGVLVPIVLWVVARRVSRGWSVWGLVVATAVTVAVGAGLYLAWVGGGRAHDSIRTVHAAAGAGAALLCAAWLVALSIVGAPSGVSRSVAMGSLILVTILVAGAAAARATGPGRLAAASRIENPDLPPLTMDQEGGGTTSPFFPSSARTSVGGVPMCRRRRTVSP